MAGLWQPGIGVWDVAADAVRQATLLPVTPAGSAGNVQLDGIWTWEPVNGSFRNTRAGGLAPAGVRAGNRRCGRRHHCCGNHQC